MKNQEQSKVGIALYSELLRRELAAVEVYRLADALLDSDLGGPNYDDLRQRHQEQVDSLIALIRSLGGEPCSSEVSWDRPHTAVLCAATLYGFEVPELELRELEGEIVRAYRIAVSVDSLETSLAESLSTMLLPSACETLELLKSSSATHLGELESKEADEMGSRSERSSRSMEEGAA
ncbi:hypothetical protein [Pelagicoccus sp. SDUM812002]|uniref:hypothetical protein n=1 Tax=Pelagicoccus sp. SDUM812002 TaxID=3041266 RepID=UPI00280EA0D1|nr:hypothetical protein [Pelagicoccus sp. SDUM812002]MDQ8186205.1 hypothetical protein [Pelagicoccus sp. SDUM812002]